MHNPNKQTRTYGGNLKQKTRLHTKFIQTNKQKPATRNTQTQGHKYTQTGDTNIHATHI